MTRTQPLPVTIRDAVEADMAAIQAIYAFYVTRTAASFEETPPDTAEITARWRNLTGRGMPFLVAEEKGEVLGYTYAGPFRQRSAYRYTVEDSIYVAPFVVRRGIGKILLAALIERCTQLGYRQIIAVIGDSANQASIALHRATGFGQEGVLRGVGLKFGRWVDVVIMHRTLGGDDRPLPDGGKAPPLTPNSPLEDMP
ncbi:GNAT family N-acetyltransferase [Paramagnetospirillum kuznetsovii]|uniref:GNAT family N-acetyltransferase n=1 Tax=Paramagnetospirillum kuznetsovii TaxID=2053833 RepID=A0A364P0R2_9PROT|nr:GNAT family N-acetyltransferase [Paramagnetospirillum kuznetsovii]RAU22705.1 GNAT family N-acetyltransferase [Paramagnetospirillum kuznetsovii]